jgi:hypothetical protein
MTSTRHTTQKTATRLASAAIIMMACTPGPVGPSSLPDGAVPFDPPAEYQTWWERTEACSGQSGDLGSIEWYTVPGVRLMQTEIGEKVGLWRRANGQTTVTIAGDYVDNELVVSHEMLHELLVREGHPEEYFVERCGLTWDSWQVARGN